MKRISLVVLAAGASRRFGNDDKLLAPWRGRPLLAGALDAFQSAPVSQRLAIVRRGTSPIAAICRDFGFDVLKNNAADDGMASSIALAANHCRDDADGLMIALGDMPLIEKTTIAALLAICETAAPNAIIAPTYKTRRGHPVVFSTVYLPELSALKGDRGASAVIGKHETCFTAAPVDDEGVVVDFDDPADFLRG